MSKFKLYLSLFWSMFKIGLFTFGGGYAMIAVIERELIEKKQWLNEEEFTDLIAVAESTPGPLAINSATFIGYKKGGVLGSVFCTLGVALPSFIIIFLISLFFDAFLQLKFVQYAFKGIQACVAFLILSAGLRMLKKLKGGALNIILFLISTVCLILLTLFSVNFSTIFYVLIGGSIGTVIYLIFEIKKKSKKGVSSEDKEESK